MENREIENNIYIISRAFAVRIINMYNYLIGKKEFVMSKQLLRSGTSIGANIFEGKNAQSTADFISKLSIALKEATESAFWIDLLHETQYINDDEFESIFDDCQKIMAILIKILKTTKDNNNVQSSKFKV